MRFRLFAGVFLPAMLLVCADAAALTKLRQGFATMLVTDGVSLIPRNPVNRAHAGDDVYFWIQWKEPVPKSSLRCVITGPDNTNIDETQNFAEAEGEGFSVCGMETEDSDGGTYYFTQYLDGEKVGESSINIEKEPFFKLSMRKKWKYMLGALGFVAIGAYWIRRKMTGDTRSLKQVLGGESAAERAVQDAIAIGTKAGGGVAVPPIAARVPEAPKPDPATELRKMGLQFQMLIGQPDKSQGLELGARYIGQLLKAGREADALKVFKECLAASPAFRLAQAEEVLPMAKAARAANDPQAAVAAVRGFDKAYPGHALIPDVYLFSAKLMAEDLRNVDMARKILEHVLAKYPGHYLAQEAKRYLQAMPQKA
jgi:tetratricopeptide (TPR) repeat protein